MADDGSPSAVPHQTMYGPRVTASRQLPSISELDLSCSKQGYMADVSDAGAAGAAMLSRHQLESPTRPSFAGVSANPSVNQAPAQERRGHVGYDAQRTSAAIAPGADRLSSKLDATEQYPTLPLESQGLGGQLAPIRLVPLQYLSHEALNQPQGPRKPQATQQAKHGHPPLSPARPQLRIAAAAMPGVDSGPAAPGHSPELSSPTTDDVLLESRRQRRESKERRRRKDQRNLTGHMEASVPGWVFNRLKTRHSASKVNGGGRATNAVISGACVWLRVQDRAMREGIPHWATGLADSGLEAPSMERWLQLVDDEAVSLEEDWGIIEEDGGLTSSHGGSVMEFD